MEQQTFTAHRLTGRGVPGEPVESMHITAASEEDAAALVRKVWRFAAFVIVPAAVKS